MVWRRLADILASHGAAALVGVHDVKGSAPREAGARMVVRPDGAFHGTIGGGQLEWQALAAARQALRHGRTPARFAEQALGPDLGQCCGGRVTLLIETFGREDSEEVASLAHLEGEGTFELVCRLDENGRVRRERVTSAFGEGQWREGHGESLVPLLLFGAGHVGRAVALALAPLPFAVRWIDSRDEAFPAHIPSNVTPVRARDPVTELAHAAADAFVLVMTHGHPLDLAITAAALQGTFPYVGLIGSDTKRARFEKRFREIRIPEARIRSLVCPIGLPGIGGKDPAVIAASVAAQLLQERERQSQAKTPPKPRSERLRRAS
jgi:xanthine dehydrogenase accessory factor